MKNVSEINLFDHGADWIKCDLHLHSPLVENFTLPSSVNLNFDSDLDNLIDLYISQLKKTEIKLCAITDYQQIRPEWFINFQKKSYENGIYVFPGVELSINYGKGLHILLLFPYDEDINGINDYIKALDQKPNEPLIINKRKHRDISLREDLKVVLDKIKKEFNWLIIFPHLNEKNGLLSSFQPKEAAEFLKYADAIEFIDDREIQKIIDTNVLEKSFLGNFAIIENSDPKSIDQIGSKQRGDKIRSTYIKLSSVSINSLRIAFQDPSLRIKLYEKPEELGDKIESIEISGSKFLKNVKLNFNSNLNCLIGGRGVGKSAIIESIRYCLNLPFYADQSFKEEFVQNVVGSGGKITVRFFKCYGDRKIHYTVSRIIGQQPFVEGKNILPDELFEENLPILLGQKELYVLSNNQEFQRKLVDQLIGDDIKRRKIEFGKKLNLLKENAAKLLNLQEKLLQKEDYEQRLNKINEQIKIFEDLGVAQKLKKLTLLTKDSSILNTAISKFKSSKDVLINQYNDLILEINNAKNILAKGESPEKQLLSNASNILSEYKEYLENQLKDFSYKSADIEKKLDIILSDWNKSFEICRNESEEIKKELSAKDLSPDEYEKLIQEKVQLEPLLKEYDKLERQKQILESERELLKKELQKERHNLFEFRRKRIEEINKKLAGRVILEVSYQLDKNEFKDKLGSLLYGSKVSEDAISKIIDNERITIDGIELSNAVAQGAEELKAKFQLTDAMSKRIVEWFNDKSKLYQLELFFPEDLITIKLKVGEDYKPFEKLSDGQKATALLILLFSQEKRILIIDQPEEDLDNRFIYDDIIVMLREMKGKRQLIFATHNANIPVLGDSEQVFVLDVEADHCNIRNSGSIDKLSIAEEVKKIMEGGEEAFKKRIQKYGVKL